MRRPNPAVRNAASAIVSGGSTTQLRQEPSDRLSQVEQEVAQLKEALATESAEITAMSNNLQELFMRNACEEYLNKLERRLQVIENKDVRNVHWHIDNVDKVRSKIEKGDYIASPSFSLGGLDGFSFHFYPRGDDFAEEGYCSLYFHVPKDAQVERTLFIGKEKNGPCLADSVKNCGISEMCVLSNQVDRNSGAVVIGVMDCRIVSSPDTAETRTELRIKYDPKARKSPGSRQGSRPSSRTA